MCTHPTLLLLASICDRRFPCLFASIPARTGSLDMKRFFLSPFFHVDDLHLVYNMISFLWKGVTLELTMNLHDYVGLLAYCTVASQTLLLLSSYALVIMFGADGPMNACTVGFSGVLFALKYVAARRSPGVTEVRNAGGGTAIYPPPPLAQTIIPSLDCVGFPCIMLYYTVLYYSLVAVSDSSFDDV